VHFWRTHEWAALKIEQKAKIGGTRCWFPVFLPARRTPAEFGTSGAISISLAIAQPADERRGGNTSRNRAIFTPCKGGLNP
jgi:hypothetical protein